MEDLGTEILPVTLELAVEKRAGEQRHLLRVVIGWGGAAACRSAVRVEEDAHAKVGDLEGTFTREEYVGRLKVQVEDAIVVDKLKSRAELHEHLPHAAFIQATGVAKRTEVAREVATFSEFGADVQSATLLPRVGILDNARVGVVRELLENGDLFKLSEAILMASVRAASFDCPKVTVILVSHLPDAAELATAQSLNQGEIALKATGASGACGVGHERLGKGGVHRWRAGHRTGRPGATTAVRAECGSKHRVRRTDDRPA